jgi:hypothetical protein
VLHCIGITYTHTGPPALRYPRIIPAFVVVLHRLTAEPFSVPAFRFQMESSLEHVGESCKGKKILILVRLHFDRIH